jgi:hypothetical protein
VALYQITCEICGKIVKTNWNYPDEYQCKCAELKVLAKPIEEIRREARLRLFDNWGGITNVKLAEKPFETDKNSHS